MKLFLGYPSERISEARTIYEFLTSLGLDVWFDKESLVPGEDWQPERENAQSKADLIVHLISPEVLTRPGDVQREYRLSLERAKAQPFGSLLVIPILIGEVVVPREFSHLQYAQYSREDWRYRLCKGIVRKFEQMNVAVVDGLNNYVNSESSKGGRIDLKINDVTPARDLQADYFKYRYDGRYFDYINAKISDRVLTSYYEWKRNETTLPEGDMDPSGWQLQAKEFFRSGDVVSLTFEYWYYWTGAAHGQTGVEGLNFAGQNIGKFELSELFGRELSHLKFLIEYVKLGARQQLLEFDLENPPDFLVDFDDWVKDPEEGWRALGNFNFDKQNLILYFNPYALLAFAFGTIEIKLEWQQIWGRVSSELKAELADALGLPNS
jgi:hypothetical protein